MGSILQKNLSQVRSPFLGQKDYCVWNLGSQFDEAAAKLEGLLPIQGVPLSWNGFLLAAGFVGCFLTLEQSQIFSLFECNKVLFISILLCLSKIIFLNPLKFELVLSQLVPVTIQQSTTS